MTPWIELEAGQFGFFPLNSGLKQFTWVGTSTSVWYKGGWGLEKGHLEPFFSFLPHNCNSIFFLFFVFCALFLV